MKNRYLEKLKKEIKIKKALFRSRPASNGMTLIELVVTLGIFAVLASVSIFNYNGFQSKVNITNLADDIALQVVQAQNASLNGLLPIQTPVVSPWKPSYGVYFSTSATDVTGADNKDFIYFVDLDNKQDYTSIVASDCTPPLTKECLSKYTITKNNNISTIYAVYTTSDPLTKLPSTKLDNLTITFARPNSGAILKSTTAFASDLILAYVEITITNQKGNVTSTIDLYPSGRVQIN